MTDRTLLTALAIVAFCTAAPAGQLDDVIKRNQQALDETVRQLRLFDPQEVALPPARLWVHTRVPAQDTIVAAIEQRIAGVSLPGGPVAFKPVQRVEVGPDESQLRFFKSEDRERADKLAEALTQTVPDLVVRDFTAQYDTVSWLKPGHFELWLAPDVR